MPTSEATLLSSGEFIFPPVKHPTFSDRVFYFNGIDFQQILVKTLDLE